MSKAEVTNESERLKDLSAKSVLPPDRRLHPSKNNSENSNSTDASNTSDSTIELEDNSWSPMSTVFDVRSKTYMVDQRKMPSESALLQLVDVDIVDLVQCETRQTRLHCHNDSYATYLRDNGDSRRILVVVWQLHPRYLVLTFVENNRIDCEASLLFDRFIDDMNNESRAKRFKLLPQVHNFRIPGVNLSRPCIIANKITTEFYTAKRLVEVDINVFSSRVARFILGYVEKAAASLIIELGFTIEGTIQSELPERILGGAKLYKVDLSSTRKSEITDDEALTIIAPKA